MEYKNFFNRARREKALLISATGTGKTYASDFALRELNPRRVLFLVHREQIAKQAIESYKKIFWETKTFGLLSENLKDFETDYLFSTMQMMSKEEFDIIVIDEAHRVGSKRETKAKLNADIDIKECFDENTYHYIKKDMKLVFYKAKLLSSNIELLEHENVKWVTEEELKNYEFAADVAIVNKFKIK